MHDMEALNQRFDGVKTALAQRRRRNERVRKHLNELTAALDRLPARAPAGLEDLRAEIGRLAVENRRLRSLVAQHQKAEAAQQPEAGRQESKSDVARLLGGADDEDDADSEPQAPGPQQGTQAVAERQGAGSAVASEIVQGLIRELDEDAADAPE